ncbi:hypothetical protein [Streptomyces griseofuscus]
MRDPSLADELSRFLDLAGVGRHELERRPPLPRQPGHEHARALEAELS